MLVLFPEVFVTRLRIVVSLVSIIISGQLYFPTDCLRLFLCLFLVFLFCILFEMLLLDLPRHESVVNFLFDVDPDFSMCFLDFLQVLLGDILGRDSILLEVL